MSNAEAEGQRGKGAEEAATQRVQRQRQRQRQRQYDWPEYARGVVSLQHAQQALLPDDRRDCCPAGACRYVLTRLRTQLIEHFRALGHGQREGRDQRGEVDAEDVLEDGQRAVRAAAAAQTPDTCRRGSETDAETQRHSETETQRRSESQAGQTDRAGTTAPPASTSPS